MIGYVTIGSNDVAKACAFYDPLMASIGAKRLMEFPEDQGSFTLWGTDFAQPGLAVTKPFNQQPADKGNGNMVALTFDGRAKVDSFYAKALECGGSDDGAPGVRGDDGPQAFYAAYFRDPEGNKLCAFCIGPAE